VINALIKVVNMEHKCTGAGIGLVDTGVK